MTFKEATDRLLALGVDLREIAEALQLGHQTVRAMRAAEGTRAARTPPVPSVWRPALKALARERSRALDALADSM
jgi:hypothetical protein